MSLKLCCLMALIALQRIRIISKAQCFRLYIVLLKKSKYDKEMKIIFF